MAVSPMDRFLAWIETQINNLILGKEIEPWKNNCLAKFNICSRLREYYFFDKILDITEEAYNFLSYPTIDLKGTLKSVVPSIFMGKKHPFILLEEKYIPVYTIWLFAATKDYNWSLKHKKDLWSLFKKGYYLFVNSPENLVSDHSKMKNFQGFIIIILC
jgi:hypothetical protein